jgi:hypothetical protein
MGSIIAAYGTATTITMTLTGVLTSATLTGGRSSAAIDNSAGAYIDRPVTVKFTTGTTPTVSTVIELWMIPVLDDTTYADVFDGTDKSVTVTTRGLLCGYGTLLDSVNVDSASSYTSYYLSGSPAAAGGTLPPKKYQLFITHNTGVLSSTSAGGFQVKEFPEYLATT